MSVHRSSSCFLRDDRSRKSVGLAFFPSLWAPCSADLPPNCTNGSYSTVLDIYHRRSNSSAGCLNNPSARNRLL